MENRLVRVTCFYSCFLARFVAWFSGTQGMLAGLTTLESNNPMQNISLYNWQKSWQYFHSYHLSKNNFMKHNLRPYITWYRPCNGKIKNEKMQN